MKGVLTLVVLVAVSVGIFALGSVRKGVDGKALLNVAEEVALTVKVEKPEQGSIVRLVQAPGDVEAVSEVEISSEIVSKIVEMPIEEGDVVHRGDLLCRLDDKNLLADVESGEARIAQLRAGVVQAEVELEKAKRDLSRQMELAESDATSDREVRDYMTAHKRSASIVEMRGHEISQAEAFLKRIREDLKKTIITSPIDGVISKLNAKEGEVVITGTMNNPGTVIMTVSDLSKMQVRARVDEVDVPLVLAGQSCRIYLQSDPDAPVPARVIRVASKGTKSTGRDVVTFEALLEVLSDDARIKPGMTANVEIEVAKRDGAITIPVEAVVHRMRKELPDSIVAEFDKKKSAMDLSERFKRGQYIKVVYVKDGDTAKVRLIDAGIADTRQVEIIQGVTKDDLVIIGPYRSLDQLKNGKRVALAEEDKPSDDEKDPEARLTIDDSNDNANDSQANPDSQETEKLAASGTP